MKTKLNREDWEWVAAVVLLIPLLALQLYIIMVQNFLHNLVVHHRPTWFFGMAVLFRKAIYEQLRHYEYINGPEWEL